MINRMCLSCWYSTVAAFCFNVPANVTTLKFKLFFNVVEVQGRNVSEFTVLIHVCTIYVHHSILLKT